MDLSLEGKRALVCGASKGIGQAIAIELSRLGAHVIAVARSEEGLNKTLEMLEGRKDHLALSLDLSNTNDVQRKLSKLLDHLGEIEVLVCNAGGPKAGPIENAEVGDFEEGFRTHVLANQTLLKSLLPGMKKNKYGRVINIISTSVKVPIANLGVSNTIRGAVANWSKSMANELGPFGITVNNVLPGFTNTERLSALKSAAADRMNKSEDEVEKMWKGTIPLRRFAEPQETAQAVAFLASPSAAYISGINLPVDGGRTGSL